MSEILPIYKIALRDDLKNDARFLPTKADPEATGYDVRAAFSSREDLVLRAGQYFKIPLGFRCFCPPGWWYQLHPRSSSFVKKQMHNLIGIIDETYPNELIFAGQYIPDVGSLATDLVVTFGDPIGQIIPVKRQEVEMQLISNTDINELFTKRNATRTGGFGSTTK